MRLEIAHFVSVFLQIYTICVFAWALLSWFEIQHSIYYNVRRFLDSVVEPYVRLFRGLPFVNIGSMGLDISPIIAILVLQFGGRIIVELIAYGI